MSKNDITGDRIGTKIGDADATRRFNENFDRIFGKKKPEQPGKCESCGCDFPNHWAGCGKLRDNEGGKP